MKTLQEMMSEIKAQLKNGLTSESSTEEVQRITNIDNMLDDLMDETEKLEKDYKDLKDLYIEQVKSTGFKANGSDNNDIGLDETKSLDDILIGELNKITA